MAETSFHKTFENLPTEYSVSQISEALKREVENAFSCVRVRGEISRMIVARSGHVYLTMKDSTAVLDGVCWRGSVGRLGISPEEGMEVIVEGRLSTYPGRSSYQIIIEKMEHAGEGALLKLLEERKKKFLEEGLFDQEKKKKLPYLPGVIGVVTSPDGAVIKDILHRLKARFPTQVLLWPVNVQGKDAADQITRAIKGFSGLGGTEFPPRPELIIVARGGGSLEDLWPFNEEPVVRATAACPIPIISAIGHETDTTLIDFASDQRAPTPTAAAEIAVPMRSELLERVNGLGLRLLAGSQRWLESLYTILDGFSRGLQDPARLVNQSGQYLDDRISRMEIAKSNLLLQQGNRVREISGFLVSPGQLVEYKAEKLSSAIRTWEGTISSVLEDKSNLVDKVSLLLEGASYQRTLEKGFSLVTDKNGKTVSFKTSSNGMEVDIQFFDGSKKAQIREPKKKKPRDLGKASKVIQQGSQGKLL